jgi:hypothetical protein
MARLGQIYERREPAGDDYDRLIVCGQNGSEIALRPVDGLDVIGADPAELARLYVLAADAPEPTPDRLVTQGGNALGAWI